MKCCNSVYKHVRKSLNRTVIANVQNHAKPHAVLAPPQCELERSQGVVDPMLGTRVHAGFTNVTEIYTLKELKLKPPTLNSSIVLLEGCTSTE
jgi:hypothetical protein